MTKKHYRLYMDESFPGDFSFDNPQPRKDGINCYCFAGVLIAEENIESIRKTYKEFIAKWGINYPLHYVNIRGRRGNFDWLAADKATSNRDPQTFIDEYHDFMFNLPYEVFGGVIDREYFEKDNSHFSASQMRVAIRKRAFEFPVAYVALEYLQDNSFKIFIEQAGKKEDRSLQNSLSSLKEMGFSHPIIALKANSSESIEFMEIIPEKLIIVDKTDPFVQIADFCAFILAKSHYDKNYRPFLRLTDKIGDIAYIPSKEMDA
jgi:Protein of unknown function (DUF3800)